LREKWVIKIVNQTIIRLPESTAETMTKSWLKRFAVLRKQRYNKDYESHKMKKSDWVSERERERKKKKKQN